MRKRNALLLFGAFAILWAFSPTALGACEVCFANINGIFTCGPASPNEVGFTLCAPLATRCQVGGDFCSVIDAGGGGSGGSGGGGGACQGGSGGCPAECFSCSGGGGRPRI